MKGSTEMLTPDSAPATMGSLEKKAQGADPEQAYPDPMQAVVAGNLNSAVVRTDSPLPSQRPISLLSLLVGPFLRSRYEGGES